MLVDPVNVGFVKYYSVSGLVLFVVACFGIGFHVKELVLCGWTLCLIAVQIALRAFDERCDHEARHAAELLQSVLSIVFVLGQWGLGEVY